VHQEAKKPSPQHPIADLIEREATHKAHFEVGRSVDEHSKTILAAF
jgi:hypothetical protein